MESNKITLITKLTTEQQNQLLRYFVRLVQESKVKIMEINRDIFYPLKQKNTDTSLAVVSYVSLILSIQKFKNQTSEVDLNAIKIRTKTLRLQPKRDRLIGYWALVKTLKNEKNLSFRQIAKYLTKYHKLNVVHSSIHKLWQELEKKEN